MDFNNPMKLHVLFPVVTFISSTALLFALTMQYGFHLQPCHLCMFQRWPYLFTAIAGLVGFLTTLGGHNRMATGILMLCTAAFIIETGLGFYHAGVEQHWWRSIFEGCTITFDNSKDLMQQIMERPAARCDEIAWSFLGLSMAAWNTVLAAILSGICATGVIRNRLL